MNSAIMRKYYVLNYISVVDLRALHPNTTFILILSEFFKLII